MKAKVLQLFLVLIALSTNAQEIEITLKESSPYKLFQSVLIGVELINTTNKPLTYFDSRGTSWDSYKETWDLKIDGQSVELFYFSDAHEGRFSVETIITLQPGEKRLIRNRLIDLKSPGRYTISYSQEQSPTFVKKNYAKDVEARAAVQIIDSFKVSNKLEFEVLDSESKSVNQLVEMTWDEWKEYVEKQLIYENKNNFSQIEEAFKNPEKVYSLDIQCDGISKEMIERIGLLKNLKSLKLNNYHLDIFPEELAKLNLYELTIYPKKNHKVEYPFSFSQNNTIRKLNAKFYGGLPDEVLLLENLELLDVRYCPIISLPDLSPLRNLRVLIANDSELKSIENIGLNNLHNLEELDFSGNKSITDISPITSSLNLKIISFSRTNIKIVSDQIGNLVNLENINLGANEELAALPSSITTLKNLKYLNLNYTNMQMLPDGISELPLEEVFLIDTKCKKTDDYKILKKRLDRNFRD